MTKIAITSFIDKFDYFADEANQMTLSGKYLNDSFTFILFVEPEIINKIKKRHNVLIFPYESKKDEYYENYRYAKSLEFLKSNENILNAYDYIIKTDSDVFLTESLNNYPFDNRIHVSVGHYAGTEKSIIQLYDFANKFGYKNYKRINNFGATLIGPSKQIINIMNQADKLCKLIFNNLCPDGDYTKQISETWTKSLYSGTSTMIATEIVMSSILDQNNILITNKIDSSCFSGLDYSDYYHIHQWHGDDMYSKFKARSGEYDNLTFKNDKSVPSYCLNIFLENKRENLV